MGDPACIPALPTKKCPPCRSRYWRELGFGRILASAKALFFAPLPVPVGPELGFRVISQRVPKSTEALAHPYIVKKWNF